VGGDASELASADESAAPLRKGGLVGTSWGDYGGPGVRGHADECSAGTAGAADAVGVQCEYNRPDSQQNAKRMGTTSWHESPGAESPQRWRPDHLATLLP
jgi:hypothetical protein